MYGGQGAYSKVIPVVIVLLVCFQGVMASPICLLGDFESQVRGLVSNQMLSRTEIANLSTVFYSLQNTLQILWPGSQVIPIGSVLMGMAMKSSDADCMVKVPYFNIYNTTASRYLVMQAAGLLRRQPNLYANVKPDLRTKNQIALLKFNYIPTQKDCDVNFISTKGLRISRMIGNYYRLDNRAWTIAVIIKFWSKVHGTKTNGIVSSYALNLLIIFYLQQENILPPYYLLQNIRRRPIYNSRMCLDRSANDLSVYQLLGGFFTYYSKFNFEEYVVSAFLGRPIHKREFDNIESPPDELPVYKKYMRTSNSKSISTNTMMSIQDVFSLHPSVEDVSPIRFVAFMSHIKFAANRFKFLTSDHFLRAILLKDKHDDTFTSVIDEVKKIQDCVNKTVSISPSP